MYEDLRNDLLLALSEILDTDTLRAAIEKFDRTIINYNVSRMSTDLTVRGREDLEEYAKLYVVCKKLEGCTEETIYNYSQAIKAFINYTTVPLSEITANIIRKFLLLYKMDHPIDDRSLDKLRGNVAAWFKWLQNEGYITQNPCANVAKIKYPVKQKPALDANELERLRSVCRDDLERALVEVLYSTGCRISEALKIKVDDVNWDDPHPEYTLMGKGRKEGTVYFSPRAVYAVKRYLNSRRHDSEYLFINNRGGEPLQRRNAEKKFKTLRILAGLENKRLTPHTMRHTMGTQALKVAPVQVVQKLLRHSNINTTLIYAEQSQSSVKQYHGLLQ